LKPELNHNFDEVSTRKHAVGVKINILKTPESSGHGVQAVERNKVNLP
jgi:hypothetical protein